MLEISGRTYPVDTCYLEAAGEDAELNERIVAAVEQIFAGVYGVLRSRR